MSLSQQAFQNGILWGVLWYMGLQFFNGSRRDMWGGLKSQITLMFSQGVRVLGRYQNVLPFNSRCYLLKLVL